MEEEVKKFQFANLEKGERWERPRVLAGETHQVVTNVGTVYITLNHHQGKLVEVILSETDGAIGKLVSLMLQHGIEPEQIIGRLETKDGDIQKATIPSITQAVAKIIQLWVWATKDRS